MIPRHFPQIPGIVDPNMGVSTGASLVLSAALGSGEALPAWLHFDPSRGAFWGTPPVLEDASGGGTIKENMGISWDSTNGIPEEMAVFFFWLSCFFFECVDDFWDIWSHSPMKHLPVFQYSSPGNLFCIGCCVQRLSESICRIWQPRWPWVLGSCGVSAWCARLDTQTFRRSVGHRHLLRPRCSLTRTRNLRSSTSPQWVAQRIQMVFNKITLFSRGKRPPKFDPKCVNLKHGISGRCLIIIWTKMG